MPNYNNAIESFLENYEKESDGNAGDLVDVLYNDPFMNADPNGVHVVTRDMVRMAIAKRRELFHTIGLKSTQRLSLEKIPLNDQYMMIRAVFQFHFEKNAGEPVQVINRSTFILFVTDDSAKIVYYQTDLNIIQELQKLGLLALSS